MTVEEYEEVVVRQAKKMGLPQFGLWRRVKEAGELLPPRTPMFSRLILAADLYRAEAMALGVDPS